MSNQQSQGKDGTAKNLNAPQPSNSLPGKANNRYPLSTLLYFIMFFCCWLSLLIVVYFFFNFLTRGSSGKAGNHGQELGGTRVNQVALMGAHLRQPNSSRVRFPQLYIIWISGQLARYMKTSYFVCELLLHCHPGLVSNLYEPHPRHRRSMNSSNNGSTFPLMCYMHLETRQQGCRLSCCKKTPQEFYVALLYI